MYHNTTQESPIQESLFSSIAAAQDDRIKEYFLIRKGKLITPDMVYDDLYANTRVPITSVRRSFHTLTSKGVIIKTEEKKKGNAGRNVYCWMMPTRR